MSWEPFEWENEKTSWALIKNKYGTLLSYNLKRYHKSYASCGYQGYITEMLETKKYFMFVDVGAYIGLFSQIAANNCFRVLSYEAHPFYYGVLLFNMKREPSVKCFYKYITWEFGLPSIKNDIKSLVSPKEGISYKIETSTLDRELHDYLNFDLVQSIDRAFYEAVGSKILIKLDVEGNERNVLEGSKEILKKSHFHWIIDIHTQHGVNPQEIADYFPNRKKTWISPKVLKVEGKE